MEEDVAVSPEIIEDENDIDIDESTISTDESNVISLPLGEELSSEAIYPIMATEQSKFIVIMGGTKSGKTTLVTALYQQFLKKKISDKYHFAGSQTLMAFENRAHFTRTMSKQSQSTMQRTPLGSLDKILHLRIKNLDMETFENLLFTDPSGEDYERVICNVAEAKEDFQIVRAAHCIVLLIDGEKFADVMDRNLERQKSIDLLRTFQDSGLLNPKSKIIVVVSKYDLITKEENKKLTIAVRNLLNDFVKQLPKIKKNLQLHYIAAMPCSTNEAKSEYGLDELLELLLSPQYELEYEQVLPIMKSQFNMWEMRSKK